MGTLKVLSIDMDFFQEVDYNTLIECYPDGHDYPAKLSTIVWASHYSNPSERRRLKNVSCPEEQLSKLKSTLSKQKSRTPILIAPSHKDIYDFIEYRMKRKGAEFLEIVNIDMHHDMFFEDGECEDLINLHCGNWAHYIMKEHPTRFTWISNPVSKQAMDYSTVTDLRDVNIVEGDLSVIAKEKFDAIFLCRSDAWYPPHLDYKFVELFKLMCDKFYCKDIRLGLDNREGAYAGVELGMMDAGERRCYTK